MKTLIKLAAIVLLVGIGGYAAAKYVGRYYCAYCQVGAGVADGDTLAFIREVVNRLDKQGSWIDPKGRPNQVTICNGTKCSIYTVAAMTAMFVSSGYWYSDWKGENTGGGGGIGIGGGPISGGGDNPWQDCISGSTTGQACTSVDGGPKSCVEVEMPSLNCPGMN